MLDVIPYIVYFLGPIVLAFFVGRRLLKATYSAFAIGLLAFFVAWVCVLIVTQVPVVMSDSLKYGTVLYSIIVSASAGLFEESSRFFAFRIFKGLREKRNWNTGIMYTIGHSGMESIIVGGSLLLTIVIVKYAPEKISPELLSTELLSQSRAVLEIGFWQGLYSSFERLFVGLLSAGMTCLVLLSLIKSEKKYLLLAMLWHFGHDMVGLNLHRISDHWIAEKFWIVFIVVVYSWILLRLRKTIASENHLIISRGRQGWDETVGTHYTEAGKGCRQDYCPYSIEDASLNSRVRENRSAELTAKPHARFCQKSP